MLFPHMLHGGDYNPDQWLDRPDILAEDIELMKKAGVNTASLGIFAWAALEPQEGVYEFGWLTEIIENLYKNGIYTVLATPSGARPTWMAKKYPEVLRVGSDLVRNQMGGRHNHCYTSPVYREKTYAISKKLSETFGKHPGVILWHLSNEYSGECYCPLCQEEFRRWLQNKYKTISALNDAWWTRFWSFQFSGWQEIDPPLPKGNGIQGQRLDWMRFVTDRTIDFMAWEKKAVRDGGSSLPVTTNFMGFFQGLNYNKFRDILDIVSWDSYPRWHNDYKSDIDIASETAATHDLMRSILPDKPFLLMESTPSTTTYMQVSKVKRPGVHMLSSMQAVAHGSDSVQYFQWRKSRGSAEKFHGAVVSHDRRSDTRVFKDCADVGTRLAGLDDLVGSVPRPRAAVLYDRENQWALNFTAGPRNKGLHYQEAVISCHKALWQLGIDVDVPDMESDLSPYSLIFAPMLYMLRAGISDKLRDFVQNGGVLVSGCLTGLVDENDLCFLGDAPYGLTDLFGLRAEEFSGLYDGDENHFVWNGEAYSVRELIELVRPEGASVLAAFTDDFYRGEAAVCENKFGKGRAFYIAGGTEQRFLADLTRKLSAELHLESALGYSCDTLPDGVTVQSRCKGDKVYIIVQNYTDSAVSVPLSTPVYDIESGEHVAMLDLAPYGVRFFAR